MSKAKQPTREMHRWEKMMAGATDMEELLVEIQFLISIGRIGGQVVETVNDKITAQLKRTGRIK